MIRCLVVDDDPVARAVLERYVRMQEDLELAGSCADAMAAAAVLRRESIDLLFLDVEMPELSGLDLARSLERRPEIVLVTGSASHALAAFEVEVADYLLKPIDPARFLRALERVHRRIAERGAAVAAANDSAAIFVKVDGRLTRVAFDELFWVEARGDYVLLHLPEKRHIVHATMKAIEEKLPTRRYARVHRSHIVRLDRIADVEESNVVIGENVIPIGASYREALLARISSL